MTAISQLEPDDFTEDDHAFWQRVADNLNDAPAPWDPNGDPGELDVQVSRESCRVCGEAGACAYDAEGRPMIHADDDLEDT